MLFILLSFPNAVRFLLDREKLALREDEPLFGAERSVAGGECEGA